MFYWIYDIPSWQLALLIAGLCLAFTYLGLIPLRPFVRSWMGEEPGRNELVSYFLSAYGVFYGLMLGLIAVVTYENYAEVDRAVVREASSLAALFRDVSSYPEPDRTSLRSQLKEYTRYVIEEAWPLQQKGIIPKGGTERINALQKDLFKVQPASRSQELIHAEALRQFNTFIECRRQRLHNVGTGLPAVLWWVVILGAALNLAILWIFSVKSLSVHLTLSGTLALFIGLMLFLIASMDNPYRGEVSISAEAFEIVQQSLMQGD